MNFDNEFRRFRFIEANDSVEFNAVVEGWLTHAERQSPKTGKALLEGDYLAYLPDGARLKEVSYKVKHESVDVALPDWAQAVGRRFAWLESNQLVTSDGSRFPIDEIRFEPI
jgi:hypothetical protein